MFMAKISHIGYVPKAFQRCFRDSTSETISSDVPNAWMPLSDFVFMLWGVKKWRFAYSLDWDEGAPDIATWSYASTQDATVGQYNLVDNDDDYLFGTTPTTEKKLVCGVDLIEGETLFYPDYGDPFYIPFESSAYFAMERITNGIESNEGGSGTSVNSLLQWSDGATPAAFFRYTGSVLELRPNVLFSLATNNWNIKAASFPGSDGTYGTFSYKFLDKTISTSIYADNEDLGVSLSVTASLEAVEYWSFT
jgi:hypothetical protein